MVALMVNGNKLGEKIVVVKEKPNKLVMVLSWGGNDIESPGKITNVNIFSKPLSNMTQLTDAGTDPCGAAGDYLNWEEADWILRSKARFIMVDSARGPCRRESKLHVYPMKD